jgi:hypothetical protein
MSSCPTVFFKAAQKSAPRWQRRMKYLEKLVLYFLVECGPDTVMYLSYKIKCQENV